MVPCNGPPVAVLCLLAAAALFPASAAPQRGDAAGIVPERHYFQSSTAKLNSIMKDLRGERDETEEVAALTSAWLDKATQDKDVAAWHKRLVGREHNKGRWLPGHPPGWMRPDTIREHNIRRAILTNA